MKHRLLQILADGEWHSGQVLADELGISRASISNHMQSLREMGAAIHRLKGRGYRLKKPLGLLDESLIRTAMPDEQSLDEVIVRFESDSTNSELMAVDATGRHVCLAEYQSRGRGRRGRRWIAPVASSLCMSCSVDLPALPPQAQCLGLAIGVALVEQLIKAGFKNIGLKWPNDLYYADSKLGGILIEHRGEAYGQARLVIGLGLNYDNPVSAMDAVDQQWVDLSSIAIDQGINLPDRNTLAASLAAAVFSAVEAFDRSGFAVFQNRWQQFDIARDRRIKLIEGEQVYTGMARGVNASGALKLETASGLQEWVTGDISLRFG